jgi:putative hydrolase of the HAD superfamily
VGKLDEACERGMEYLVANHNLTTVEEEKDQFTQYYSIVLQTMGVASPQDGLALRLAEALVDGVNYEPFPETERLLQELRNRDLALGIVSNAWPSLDRRYVEMGLREYFRAFAISAVVGSIKPDDRIFLAAIEQIGLPAHDLIFVDDWPEIVRKAEELEMKGVLMDHKKEWLGVSDVARIENLMELPRLLDGI